MMKCNGSSGVGGLQKVPTSRLYWPENISGPIRGSKKNIRQHVLIDDNGAAISLIVMDKLGE